MTKRELIEALEALDCEDDTEVCVWDSIIEEWSSKIKLCERQASESYTKAIRLYTTV